MKYKKGQSGNPEGRPTGAKNKIGKDLRERIINFLSDEFTTVQNDFSKLQPRERVRLYCDLLQYGLPKLQAVTHEGNLERMTDSQLNDLFQKLTETANEDQ